MSQELQREMDLHAMGVRTWEEIQKAANGHPELADMLTIDPMEKILERMFPKALNQRELE